MAQGSRKGKEKRAALLASREVRATVGDETLLEASAEDFISLHMWVLNVKREQQNDMQDERACM